MILFRYLDLPPAPYRLVQNSSVTKISKFSQPQQLHCRENLLPHSAVRSDQNPTKESPTSFPTKQLFQSPASTLPVTADLLGIPFAPVGTLESSMNSSYSALAASSAACVSACSRAKSLAMTCTLGGFKGKAPGNHGEVSPKHGDVLAFWDILWGTF